MRVLSFFVAAALALFAAGKSEAALVFSDNFNANATGLGISSLVPPVWTVTNNVDIIDGPLAESFGAPSGFGTGYGSFVDLAGTGAVNADKRGTISTIQTFLDLGPNAFYAISVDLAGANRSLGQVDTVRVGLGAWFTDIVLNPTDPFATYSFAAPVGTSGSLYFSLVTAGDGTNPTGAFLDNVSLSSEVVPEPATASVFALLGLGALAARRRRRS